ncbi:type II toxin-antitoxin system HipA family toxin [Pseudochryseolinea flava]|uniref:Type II toxin-antitoxin system HipA family toxin n=1 Tax=Pseudochryseolinea flava TaxID=2059302 RepID=A0A364Y148_9BACT|nr:HipA domain-containing protein [Pseudochryseolinea flava]RAV99657.1 type II toxin-antitoxin system HipA family toxin [Pseudochryseolinea flava]
MAKKGAHRTICVYADWVGLGPPTLMGLLHSTLLRGKEIFSFEYDDAWLKSRSSQTLDPDLGFFSGIQYLNDEKPNFGIFLDSSPDRWGRTLMDRREAAIARSDGRQPKNLFETDYLLGVYDGHRMGAIRFKDSLDGPFLNSNTSMATPPWTSIRELEHASLKLEDGGHDAENLKWLNLLITPGSSLGGARPKASVLDEHGALWIAKFPSLQDDRDIGGWEKVAYDLARNAGINVPESVTGKFYSKKHTFLTKRFDRTSQGERIHFASAMTLLGHTDGTNHSSGASYLDLAEFIMQNGARPDADLEELWRRIVFYISISNTDDHLRNHGFLLTDKGWTLSPAYDINPVPTGTGLSLNISTTDNALSIDLALEVAEYFRVSDEKATEIISVIQSEVSKWESIAEKVGIPKAERNAMARAFKV